MAREEGGRLLALLAHRTGDLDLADEALQDALASAVTAWRRDGVPANPIAWLHAVARRSAIDRVRRAGAAARRHAAAAAVSDLERAPVVDLGLLDADGDADTFPDERLRLVFLCCHPALAQESQVALTLRLVGGLTTAEVAAALLIPESTVAQRIVRAKRKIRDAGIPLSLPSDPSTRIGPVLQVIYLVLNEGYLARGDRDAVDRPALVSEAIRLAEMLRALLAAPDAELLGLLALARFIGSRDRTRSDAQGELVTLDRQDRGRWDLAEIDAANELLVAAMALRDPGPFQVQALIAAHHANARTAADTDWPAIVRLYEQLVAMTDSPVVRVNHAVAVAQADGAPMGLRLLDRIDDLADYHLLHAARAELLWAGGDPRSALEHFEAATALTDNPRERTHLGRRLASCREAATP